MKPDLIVTLLLNLVILGGVAWGIWAGRPYVQAEYNRGYGHGQLERAHGIEIYEPEFSATGSLGSAYLRGREDALAQPCREPTILDPYRA